MLYPSGFSGAVVSRHSYPTHRGAWPTSSRYEPGKGPSDRCRTWRLSPILAARPLCAGSRNLPHLGGTHHHRSNSLALARCATTIQATLHGTARSDARKNAEI